MMVPLRGRGRTRQQVEDIRAEVRRATGGQRRGATPIAPKKQHQPAGDQGRGAAPMDVVPATQSILVVSIEEAATELRLSTAAVKALIQSGKLRDVEIGQFGQRMVIADDVRRLAAGAEEPPDRS
jgi:hypothetical protein